MMMHSGAAGAAMRFLASAAAVVVVCTAAGYWRERTLLAAQETPPSAQRPARRPPAATLRPHPQANLPPLELPAYEMPRPKEVVRATYRFAAEHPEVLSYMPCFCGCQDEGHRSNVDCFVKARARNGDVIAWSVHGMDCAMCIAVAERSMTMLASGAAVRDIRADVERRYGHTTGLRTPTPDPPSR